MEEEVEEVEEEADAAGVDGEECGRRTVGLNCTVVVVVVCVSAVLCASSCANCVRAESSMLMSIAVICDRAMSRQMVQEEEE